MNAALVLVRVAQAGSFRGATHALSTPKTSVSRKVAELEARLGVQLLRRTTRKVALTDAGRDFVEAAQTAFASLEAAEQAVSRHQREPQGRIRVTAPGPLGHAVLTGLLAEFLRQHPKVEVLLHLTYKQVDLLTERFDVALRFGALPDSSLIAIPVGGAQLRIVASPDYLAARRPPPSRSFEATVRRTRPPRPPRQGPPAPPPPARSPARRPADPRTPASRRASRAPRRAVARFGRAPRRPPLPRRSGARPRGQEKLQRHVRGERPPPRASVRRASTATHPAAP